MRQDDLQQTNILLVDDNANNLLALEAILHDPDRNLVITTSGEEALKYLFDQEFALILLDVQMPGMDGFEVAEIIRGRDKSQHTPIIFLTAISSSDAHTFRGYGTGAVDYIFKPFEPEILQAKVSVFVELFKRREEARRRGEALRQANKDLEREIAERLRAEVSLQKAHDELEMQVEERTRALTLANTALKEQIAERERAEEALLKSEEYLRQSQKLESIGVLAGGVAHDFNNILTAILGNTQLALRNLSPDSPLHGRLIEIEKAGNRAASLTRQLLAFSRRQRLERKTLNLNDCIHDIMKMLRRLIGEDIEIVVAEYAHLAPVFADPAQIEQVIMNLAINARDAMPAGGQLRIETRNVLLDEAYCREHPYANPGSYVQMQLSDTGMGMEDETRERIFEPFFTTKEAGRGTGLGLSMVFGIVKQHGGLIEVESEAGRGATFYIYLPVHEESVEQETPEILPPLRGGTETILVAEDEGGLRELARNILEELGYTVLLAEDGVEATAIYKARGEQIALLILDIVMPRMSGREAYEQITQQGGRVPVIFMTGYSAEIVQYEFVQQNRFIEDAGAALIQKPYSVETLGRRVREVLDQARETV